MSRSPAASSPALGSHATVPIRIGYVPLADAAPLIVADELNLFEKAGVRVELHREVGWATVREKILYHELDAAHAPAGLAFSLRLGAHGLTCPSLVPFVFNSNGNAITLASSLYQKGVRDAVTLRKLVRSTQQRLFTFGVVAPFSSHNILLRTWLESGGLDPDQDVRIVTLPPTQMVGSLAAGLLDGYCVGEPWNSAAVAMGCGWCPATSESVAPGHPEKVLLTTEGFLSQRRDDLLGLIRALDAACQYCDEPKNRKTLPDLMATAFRHSSDRDLLKLSFSGPYQTGLESLPTDAFHIFHRQQTNRPSPSQASWLVGQLIQHRVVSSQESGALQAAANACWNTDLYDEALLSPPPKPENQNQSQEPNRHKETGHGLNPTSHLITSLQ